MDRNKFEHLVENGIKAIPERFLEKLSNVAIVIEDGPTLSQKKKLGLGKGWTLFGLYEGVPQLNRGINYTGVLPDKITIFQIPIEEAARSDRDVEEMVRNTVWHELAHHFGMDERGVREAELKRKKANSKK